MKHAHAYSFLVILLIVLLATGVCAAGGLKIEFVHWYLPSVGNAGPALEDVAERFQEENPNIELELQGVGWGEFTDKVLVRAAAGEAPECSMVSGAWFLDFVRTGIFKALEPFIERTGKDMSEYFPGSMDQGRYKGNLYTLPLAGGPQRGLWYNKGMFEEAGLSSDKAPATWDELVEYGKSLVKDIDGDGEIDRWAVTNDIFPEMWMTANGADLVGRNNTLLWDSPAAVEAVEFMVDIQNRYNIARRGWLDGFKAGNFAMLTDGAWQRGVLEQADFSVGFGAFPQNTPEPRYLHSADMLALYESSQEKEAAAWKWISYLTSGEVQAEFSMRTGFPPMTRSVFQVSDYMEFCRKHPAQMVATEMMEHIVPWPALPSFTEVRGILLDWVNSAVDGQVSPDNALYNAVTKAQAIINESLE